MPSYNSANSSAVFYDIDLRDKTGAELNETISELASHAAYYSRIAGSILTGTADVPTAQAFRDVSELRENLPRAAQSRVRPGELRRAEILLQYRIRELNFEVRLLRALRLSALFAVNPARRALLALEIRDTRRDVRDARRDALRAAERVQRVIGEQRRAAAVLREEFVAVEEGSLSYFASLFQNDAQGILVTFQNGEQYYWSAGTVGLGAIDSMIARAESGSGLVRYILNNVKFNYG